MIHLVHLGLYHPDTKCNKGFPFHADVEQMDFSSRSSSGGGGGGGGSGGSPDKGTSISLRGVGADGEIVEKIVTLRPGDFAALEQYSMRIQERLMRLQQALQDCASEYQDITFVDEDNMTVRACARCECLYCPVHCSLLLLLCAVVVVSCVSCRRVHRPVIHFAPPAWACSPRCCAAHGAAERPGLPP